MFTEYSINGYYLILFITIGVLIHLILEVYWHRKRLFSIKHRIHVNGTRGKSSVVRLIAAGLRAGNIQTVAKTTGTLARFIYPDGKEVAVYRWGRTNSIEQVRIVKQAAKLKPQVLVIECMAVQPLLQSLCELKLIRSTHGVLVNARADHLDVMGPTEVDVAKALAGTMPVAGTFITTERKYLPIFDYAARDRQSDLIAVDEQQVASISDDDMAGFNYAEHKDNVALALRVCQELGVERDIALQGMWQATPDPGALTMNHIQYNGKHLILANGFAANDPLSTGELWQQMLKRFANCDKVVGLVNCRADRGDRSVQMAQAIVEWPLPQLCLAIGSGVDSFIKSLARHKTQAMNVVAGEAWSVKQILDYVTADDKAHTILLIGIGNIKDIGFALLNYFEQQRETT